MTFRSKYWQPTAIALSALNLVAVGFAAGEAEPWHAGVHATLALLLGLWAQRLRGRTPAEEGQPDLQAGLEALEFEVGKIREELSEAQERLDFAERVLAQGQESRRLNPEP
jgi:predicted outer membrane protein